MIKNDKIKIKRKDYLEHLDEQQKDAVEAPIGNTAVFAIAGSGKTRLLTYRVANMIDNGYDPKEMVLLTFTNSAASEMKKRVQLLLGKNKVDLRTGTFHSLASYFVRKYSDELQYSRNFSIMSFKTQMEMMGNCRSDFLTDNNKSPYDRDFPARHVLVEIYNRAIDHNTPFYQYINETFPYSEFDRQTKNEILMVFEDYIEKKRTYDMMDYADLLINFYDLLHMPRIQKEISQQYKHIFVDEYQDINYWQFEILKLMNQNNSLFIIGDKSQCIYQFRGADDKYVDDFEKVFKDAQTMYLTYNYRSTPNILRVAESSIRNNPSSYRIDLNTKNKRGSDPRLIGFKDENQEYEFIADEIIRLIASKEYKFKDIAVLVKKRQDAVAIERKLAEANIPFASAGGADFFSKSHVQDMLSFARFIDSPANEYAFSRTFRLFEGVGNKTVATAFEHAESINFSMSMFDLRMNKKAEEAMNFLLELYKQRNEKHISEIMQSFLDDFYLDYLIKRQMSSEDKIEDLDFIIETSKQFETTKEFLDSSALKTYKRVSDQDKRNEVSVYTIHKAKGREWDYVFIPNVNENVFPFNARSPKVPDERKLFYVSMTRAKKELCIMFTENYMGKPSKQSIFIDELDDEGMEVIVFDKD